MSEQFVVTGDFQHITIFWKEKALRFASLLMSFQFMQYIFDNKNPGIVTDSRSGEDFSGDCTKI